MIRCEGCGTLSRCRKGSVARKWCSEACRKRTERQRRIDAALEPVGGTTGGVESAVLALLEGEELRQRGQYAATLASLALAQARMTDAGNTHARVGGAIQLCRCVTLRDWGEHIPPLHEAGPSRQCPVKGPGRTPVRGWVHPVIRRPSRERSPSLSSADVHATCRARQRRASDLPLWFALARCGSAGREAERDPAAAGWLATTPPRLADSYRSAR